MTDVTGFGLAGHLMEICRGSHVNAEIDFSALPILPKVEEYRLQGCIPGGTGRNFESFKNDIGELSKEQIEILFDPQTSGGLLVTVNPHQEKDFLALCESQGLQLSPIGEIKAWNGGPLISLR